MAFSFILLLNQATCTQKIFRNLSFKWSVEITVQATKACSSSQTNVKNSIAPISSLQRNIHIKPKWAVYRQHRRDADNVQHHYFFLAVQTFLNRNVITQKKHDFCPSKTQVWFRYNLEINARQDRPDSVSKTRKRSHALKDKILHVPNVCRGFLL